MSSETTRETRKIDLGTHAVRVHESGSGPRTLFCLHDFLEEPDGWSPLAERLAGGTRVVALQQRGHGFSTAPPGSYTLGDLAADVLKVLDALAVERATLVGQGFGATVALAAALEAPGRVAGLCLIAPLVALDDKAARDWAQVVRAGEVNKLQGLARSVWGPMSRRNADGDGIALTEIARVVHRLHTEPLAPRLGEIRCPTLIVAAYGDESGVARARDVAGRIEGARLELLQQRSPAAGGVDAEALAKLLDAQLAGGR
ncbi:MAG TPA: alpha/beta fold hydrolase [Candidatus Binatia bacterium]